ncbi:hypothetical protein BJ508DRAFT_44451 [Ascobolus immersus RN42]|uniref:lytic cellulose monooxygenase (C4-dehydrogenating) n=1 Tax=Ascobolus immersus RN42 TaxID=1160509 RepID=A0A3N4HN74_ASCIM|nr:hypothetical protein BJ508DRAFT_44451 [Ascobolus immersus RN42]
MQLLSTLAVVLAAATQATAHYRFTNVIVNGKVYGELEAIRKWTPVYSNSPVTNVQSNDIRCNTGGALSQGPSTSVIDVPAGATIGFKSDQAVTHPGPFMAYLAKAPNGDVKTFEGDGNVWFKIWQKGATSISASGVTWDVSSTQWTFKLPASTPSGQYLLRMEHIGLHGASGAGGAQFYISCAQINVTGGGNGNPGPLVALPGAYRPNDPAIQINIYYPVPASYTPPGPAVWQG